MLLFSYDQAHEYDVMNLINLIGFDARVWLLARSDGNKFTN